MSDQSTVDLYKALAGRLRSRIEFAESVMRLEAPTLQIVETIALQGRKAIETIAYMTLVVTEHGLGLVPPDVRTQWNAAEVFKSLKRKKLIPLPSPSRIFRPDEGQYKLVVSGIEQYRLSYDDLIDIYRGFHDGLHEPNPYVRSDQETFYKKLLTDFERDVARLKNFTWSHFISIKGRGFVVRLRDRDGKVAVVDVTKLANDPGAID